MIHKIYIAKEHAGEQQLKQEIQLVKGKGISGDRNYNESEWNGQNLTLIELEEIDRFNKSFNQHITDSATRRNLITRGIRLNQLVGKTFTINDVKLLGVELCEPCAWLGEQLEKDGLSRKDIVKALVGRAGLRVDIHSDGKIRVGDEIENIADANV